MEEEGVDRISGLPDLILNHILSFLLTKDAIQTCATCKRLNQVWGTHPYLDLGDNFFPSLPRKKYVHQIIDGDDDADGDDDDEYDGGEAEVEELPPNLLGNEDFVFNQNIDEEEFDSIDEEVGELPSNIVNQNIDEAEVRELPSNIVNQNIDEEEVGELPSNFVNQNIDEEVGELPSNVVNQNIDEELPSNVVNQNIGEEFGVLPSNDSLKNEEKEEDGSEEDSSIEGEEEEDSEDDLSTEDDEEEQEQEEDLEIILEKREKLFTFVEQTLARMRAGDTNIQKFRLGRTNLDDELRQYLDRWIHSLVHSSNINELVLKFNEIADNRWYDLPPILQTASSLRVVTLSNCNLPCGSIFLWPSLRKLDLRFVSFDEKFLPHILNSCLYLEDLNLYACRGWKKRINVPARSQLRALQLKVNLDDVLDEVLIEAHHLEKLFYGGGVNPTKINIITNFEASLTCLHLCGANITNTWFCELISRLSRLEELSLTQLNLKAIEISSPSLKRLALDWVFRYKDNRIGEFTIDAPNLVKLKYHGCLSCVFRNSLAVKEVHLDIDDLRCIRSADDQLRNKLIQFLHNFDYSEVVTLDCSCFEYMVVPMETRLNSLAPLAHINHLILEGAFDRSPIEDFAELFESLLLIAPNLDNLSVKDVELNEVFAIDLRKLITDLTAGRCDCPSLETLKRIGPVVAAEVCRIVRHFHSHFGHR